MSEHRLDEILIERPRGGWKVSAKKLTGYRKNLDKITKEASEDGLLSPYLLKTWKRSKYFDDHLAPLRRWLHSQVGQPWDDVYSQICDRLDGSTVTGRHVLSHLWHFVELHVVLIDGLPYEKHCQDFRSKFKFFVHPDTGILCRVKDFSKKQQQLSTKEVDRLRIDDYHQYRKLDGLWFAIAFADLPPMEKPMDILLKAYIDPVTARKLYGSPVYAVSKQQCNKKELKFIRQQVAKEQQKKRCRLG